MHPQGRTRHRTAPDPRHRLHGAACIIVGHTQPQHPRVPESVRPVVGPEGARSTAPAAAVAAPISPIAPITPIRSRPGLADAQRPTAHLGRIQRVNRFVRLGVVGHLDEPEPLGAARLEVDDHVCFRNVAVRPEHLREFFRGYRIWHVADIDLQFALPAPADPDMRLTSDARVGPYAVERSMPTSGFPLSGVPQGNGPRRPSRI